MIDVDKHVTYWHNSALEDWKAAQDLVESKHMANQAIRDVIDHYLGTVYQSGIHVEQAILYGSYARGDATEWSDIDLVVIAPEFDKPQRHLINRLWEIRAITDARIEPIACGVRQWEEDAGIPLLEIARREGIAIPFEREPA